MNRLIFVDVTDAKERPLAGALVELILDGKVAGLLSTGDNGRATFEVLSDDASIEAKVTFGKEVKHQRLTDDRWKCQLTGVHLVILVHGINTRAHWIGSVQESLEQVGLKVAPAGYGRFSVPLFLLPINWARSRAVAVVKTKIDTAVAIYDPACVSVISHSFGTYIVAQILADAFNFRWHRIIFCGSVVRENFPFSQYLGRFTHPILNDIGTRDFWPAIAESVTWGYGSIGSHGFLGAPLKERWHRGFTHSQFLTTKFCSKFWAPFLTDGTVVRGDDPEPLPWWSALLTGLRIKYLILALLVASLGSGAFMHAVEWKNLLRAEETEKALRVAYREIDSMNNRKTTLMSTLLGYQRHPSPNEWNEVLKDMDRTNKVLSDAKEAINRYGFPPAANVEVDFRPLSEAIGERQALLNKFPLVAISDQKEPSPEDVRLLIDNHKKIREGLEKTLGRLQRPK